MNLEELDFFNLKVVIFASNQILTCFGTLCLKSIGSPVNIAEGTPRILRNMAVVIYENIGTTTK